MLEQDMISKLSTVIEEELGSFRPFADLPATEVEAMAARLARTISPFLEEQLPLERRNAA